MMRPRDPDSLRPPLSLLDDASLFLDFDGTLVDIADRPDAIRVGDHLRDLVARLRRRLDGRLAILTGRSADEILDFLAASDLPVCGHHGGERRNIKHGETIRDRPPALDRVLRDLRALADRHRGLIVEEKPLGLALHYRQAPHLETRCRDAIQAAAGQSGMAVQQGKMVFELKLPGVDKGMALRDLMDVAPFAGHRPVFLGDDWTDEPGFEAANRLGGSSILIGQRAETEATYALPDPSAAIAWLEAATETLR